MQFLPLITRTCNISEGIVGDHLVFRYGDHLVFRYFLPKAFLFAFLVNKSLNLYI